MEGSGYQIGVKNLLSPNVMKPNVFDIWKMESIMHECKIDENIHTAF